MLKNLSDNLNLLMAKERLNSSELARLTHLPATTIKRIRNNEQSNPTISTLLPIARHFSITIGELLGCEPSALTTNHRATSIPLLSWRECLQFDSLDYSKINIRIPTEKSVSKKCYSLRVEERDLEFFPEKSLLIIEPELTPESGDYVVVGKTEQGIASIKKYIIETDQIYLKSLVQGLGITALTSEYKILGVIIQYKIELKSPT
jgi:SOS-response transcriptional repressor LexA